MKYYGYTHLIPMWMLRIWKAVCCPRGWHAWDEVSTASEHFLYCDACEKKSFISMMSKLVQEKPNEDFAKHP
jgi:hypothetical protein